MRKVKGRQSSKSEFTASSRENSRPAVQAGQREWCASVAQRLFVSPVRPRSHGDMNGWSRYTEHEHDHQHTPEGQEPRRQTTRTRERSAPAACSASLRLATHSRLGCAVLAAVGIQAQQHVELGADPANRVGLAHGPANLEPTARGAPGHHDPGAGRQQAPCIVRRRSAVPERRWPGCGHRQRLGARSQRSVSTPPMHRERGGDCRHRAGLPSLDGTRNRSRSVVGRHRWHRRQAP